MVHVLQGKTDLAYYDWEISQFRLAQWRVLRNLLPLFPSPQPAVPPEVAPSLALLITDDEGPRLVFEENWLGTLSGLLGESVTELRRVSPREFVLTRKSACGFTSFELVYLIHWLTDPGFPAKMASPSVPR